MVKDNSGGPIQNASNFRATPFSYGAGHVTPSKAMDPGLVYDLGLKDYLNFLCALGYNKTQIAFFSKEPYTCHKHINLTNLNYPSITVPKLSGSITVTRRLKNVGTPGTYSARIQNPPGISVSVEPNRLKFKRIGEEKSFKVTIKVNKSKAASKEYVFGKLIWSDGKHYVRSPIVVKAA